ncbi:hypothetical protein GCM10020260_04080 [Nesterenkonia halobia]|uniref:Uncharacterized protein n=1 Tax=Nesterenkonia halobia TaxID=37922 RepID=A0ABP6R7L5_9MICC
MGSLTWAEPVTTLDTVFGETRASAATSFIVARGLRGGMFASISPTAAGAGSPPGRRGPRRIQNRIVEKVPTCSKPTFRYVRSAAAL